MRKRKNRKSNNSLNAFMAVWAAAIFMLAWSPQADAQVCENGSVSSGASSFSAADYDFIHGAVNSDGNLAIDTATAVFDNENMGLIPFYEEITLQFIDWEKWHRTIGWTYTIGWVYKEDAENPAYWNASTGEPNLAALRTAGKVHYLWQNVEDNLGNDGIPDTIYDTEADYDGDGVVVNDVLINNTQAGNVTEAQMEAAGFIVNGDGDVTRADMKRRIGPFKPGTEIVYFNLILNLDSWAAWSKKSYNIDSKPYYPRWDDRFFISPDAAGVAVTIDQSAVAETNDCTSTASGSTNCTHGNFNGGPSPDRFTNGWLAANGLAALAEEGIVPNTTYEETLIVGRPFNLFVLGGDSDNVTTEAMGIEPYHYGYDVSWNNHVYTVERIKGGTATLNSSASGGLPIDTTITSVTFKVQDFMPCSGKSRIEYSFSIDDGVTWIPITNWGIVETPDDATGTDVPNWHYGVSDVDGDGTNIIAVEDTYRVATIDAIALGLVGRDLRWKTEMYSSSLSCEPEVISIDVEYNASGNGEFARSAPTLLANVAYSANFEVPSDGWTQAEYRGHFTSKLVYDPVEVAYDGATENWNGADRILANIGTRSIVTPQSDPVEVVAENTGLVGDGVTVTFTGTLANSPVQLGSLSIGGETETLKDIGSGLLTSDKGGFGKVVLFSNDTGNPSGSFTITFNDPPAVDDVIYADYFYTNDVSAGNETITSFDPGVGTNTSADYALQDDYYYYYDTGTMAEAIAYHDDVDGDGFGPSDDSTTSGGGGNAPADFEVIMDWVAGYDWSSGSQQAKDWVLAGIDHSTPAVVGTPGPSLWYFGLSTTLDEQYTFDMYRCSQYDRNTVTYVGDMAGQLHAFDAGQFRPYYIDPTVYFDTATLNFNDTDCTAHYDKFVDAINANNTSGGFPVHPTWVNSSGNSPFISRGYYDDGTTPLGAIGTSSQYGSGDEIFSYIPSNMAERFKNNFFGRHNNGMVDASPSVGHIQTSAGRTGVTSWKTILVSGQGFGGSQVFALDITDETDTTPDLLWEFSDPSVMGIEHAVSLGAIGKWTGGTDGATWVVLAAAGSKTNDTENPYVFLLNAEDGGLLDKFELSSSPGSNPSGRPVMVDSDYNGFTDRIYIGTEDGILYKITTNDDPLVSSSATSVCAFYSVPQTPNAQGIYASPVASVFSSIDASGEYSPEVVILFGTADDPKLQEDIPNPQYNFYAITDTEDEGVCTAGAGSERWVLPLTAGHRVFAAGAASAGNVYFGTSTADTEDPCALSTLADDSVGSVFAIDILIGLSSVQEITNVGNITVTTVVDDEHLYIRDGSGNITGFGGSTYQNDLKRGGQGNAHPSAWRELIF